MIKITDDKELQVGDIVRFHFGYQDKPSYWEITKIESPRIWAWKVGVSGMLTSNPQAYHRSDFCNGMIVNR